MNQENEAVSRLDERIREAFKDVTYPGDDKIVTGTTMEDEEVAKALTGKTWRDIDAKFLNANCIQSIFFLDFQAYRFFLPAFLLATVQDYGKVPEIVHNLVSTLLDPVTEQRLRSPRLYEGKEAVDTYTFLCRMNPLTYRQVEVVVDVLKFLCDYHMRDFRHNEPHFALQGYWLKRLELEKSNRRQENLRGQEPLF
ncbi:MAG: hypothetical protein IH624_08465 [Phycisphaerae bacterium]|nr:hypothetical protein [Phycisphaerae bacterium]